MLRQMLKLRQARKAFEGGRFREALDLASDPEISAHLKAIQLRQRCVDALGESAAQHQRNGELSQALDNVNFLQKRGGAEVAKLNKSDIEAQIEARDGQQNRLRARFYRAKLDAERGDLLSARAFVDGIDPESCSHEMNDFRAQIDARINSARANLEAALKIMDREPKTAEARLDEAHRQHPRAEGLDSAWSRLAARKVKTVISGKIGDPALVEFLTDWALFKRSRLAGLDGAGGSLDRDLSRYAMKRIRARIDDQDLKGAQRIANHLREGLPAAEDSEDLFFGLAAFSSAAENIAAGDYEAARADLVAATEKLGKTAMGKALQADLGAQERELGPQLAAADQARKAGDLVQARHHLLDLLERKPEHRIARLRLDRLDEYSRGRLAILVKLHGDLDRGDKSAAERRLANLPEELQGDAEIEGLFRAIEAKAQIAPHKPPAPAEKVEPKVNSDAVDSAELRGLWRLSIEEAGEVLLVEDDIITLGSATGRKSRLQFLAALASRHARIERKVSFHGGVSYSIAVAEGRDLEVAGKALAESQKLADGDEIRVGRDLRLRFSMPMEGSRAALLTILSDHECEGCRRIALLPPRGRSAALVIGSVENAHIATPSHAGEIEIFRETAEAGGELVAQGPMGVSIEGEEPRARVVLSDFCQIAVGDLVMHLRYLSS